MDVLCAHHLVLPVGPMTLTVFPVHLDSTSKITYALLVRATALFVRIISLARPVELDFTLISVPTAWPAQNNIQGVINVNWEPVWIVSSTSIWSTPLTVKHVALA